ncbi:hypothetical protein JKP88DRAFT_328963 [Tribonema minus]|uniref:Uncharacterized protein n=1 Tax=Tribonema minus TaxID=303371 RepID=A0A835YR53_9STRA|nr:hypothetical protein JKP88DRAFT_328963 [Tribonema minus]
MPELMRQLLWTVLATAVAGMLAALILAPSRRKATHKQESSEPSVDQQLEGVLLVFNDYAGMAGQMVTLLSATDLASLETCCRAVSTEIVKHRRRRRCQPLLEQLEPLLEQLEQLFCASRQQLLSDRKIQAARLAVHNYILADRGRPAELALSAVVQAVPHSFDEHPSAGADALAALALSDAPPNERRAFWSACLTTPHGQQLCSKAAQLVHQGEFDGLARLLAEPTDAQKWWLGKEQALQTLFCAMREQLSGEAAGVSRFCNSLYTCGVDQQLLYTAAESAIHPQKTAATRATVLHAFASLHALTELGKTLGQSPTILGRMSPVAAAMPRLFPAERCVDSTIAITMPDLAPAHMWSARRADIVGAFAAQPRNEQDWRAVLEVTAIWLDECLQWGQERRLRCATALSLTCMWRMCSMALLPEPGTKPKISPIALCCFAACFAVMLGDGGGGALRRAAAARSSLAEFMEELYMFASTLAVVSPRFSAWENSNGPAVYASNYNVHYDY